MKGGGLNALILAAGPPKGGAKKPGGEMGGGSAEARAGSRFAQAVKGGDGQAIADAYRALKEACEASEGSPADSEYASEGDEGEA